VKPLVCCVLLACGAKPSESISPPPVDTFKRGAPPPLPPDERPISFVEFPGELNPRDDKHGMIHASASGGCHVYVRDGKARPPGSFPPETPITCPPVMRASEWGYCVGPGTVQATAARDACICQPGDGDPPAKPFRMPCPASVQ